MSPSDFVDAYPSAMVIGTDLSPMRPYFVPPNVKFELDDAQLEWTYGREEIQGPRGRMEGGQEVEGDGQVESIMSVQRA